MGVIPAPRKWLDSELEDLRAAYAANDNGFVSLRELADLLGRSYASVTLKASRMGLGDNNRA